MKQYRMFGNSNRCSIESHEDGLVVRTYYDRNVTPNFSADLKTRIPSHMRKWTGNNGNPPKVWVVDPTYGQVIVDLIYNHYGENVQLPKVRTDDTVKKGQIKIAYIGTAKKRPDGSQTAFGMDYDIFMNRGENEWSYVFEVNVLENWFDNIPLKEVDKDPMLVPRGSHYAILGLKTKTVSNDEIKSAWRRMVRQWHPDVCQEPHAQEMFMKVQKAYEVLSSPKRGLYDAGLDFAGGVGGNLPAQDDAGWIAGGDYKPGLRCGLLTVEYEVVVGRKIIRKITDWQDIVNDHGETLVTTWGVTDGKPNEYPTVHWVP